MYVGLFLPGLISTSYHREFFSKLQKIHYNQCGINLHAFASMLCVSDRRSYQMMNGLNTDLPFS